jgi:hypothetical protein
MMKLILAPPARRFLPRAFCERRRWLITRLAVALLVSLLPFATAQACSKTGKLARLMHYAGNYSSGTPDPLDKNPAVQDWLRHLPASVRVHLKRNLDVRGPVNLVDCHLVLSGNADHMGGEENAILDVNLYSGAISSATATSPFIWTRTRLRVPAMTAQYRPRCAGGRSWPQAVSAPRNNRRRTRGC